jgi:hypothetical protein
MTSSLRQRAAAASNGQPPIIAPTTDNPTDPGLVPFPDLPETTGDPEQVSVFVAWNRVMRDVAAIAKSDLYSAPGTRYNFRGVDRVVNAFGPAMRRHGVIVVSTCVTPAHRDTKSTNDKAMRETTTVVSFRVYGPTGDYFDGQAEGECLDVGDKGTAKAQSVAERVFLLITGMVPTDEPDPDKTVHERGEQPRPDPAVYRDEIVDPRTSLGRLRQLRVELVQHRLGGVVQVNESGDEEALLAMCDRIGRERRATGGES